MKTLIIFTCTVALLCSACQTYTLSNGKKHRMLFTARDKTDGSIDTTIYCKQQFNVADYDNKVAFNGKKRIIEPIEGADVQKLVNTKGTYYLYFWNQVCPHTLNDIHKLDSLSLKGANILIVCLRKNYVAIDKVLGKTNFAQYPYYTIEADRYTNMLIRKKIKFSKEACETCYDVYKDDLAVADYLMITNGKIQPVLYNESPNILKQ